MKSLTQGYKEIDSAPQRDGPVILLINRSLKASSLMLSEQDFLKKYFGGSGGMGHKLNIFESSFKSYLCQVLFLSLSFLAAAQGSWDPSSPTRD